MGLSDGTRRLPGVRPILPREPVVQLLSYRRPEVIRGFGAAHADDAVG